MPSAAATTVDFYKKGRALQLWKSYLYKKGRALQLWKSDFYKKGRALQLYLYLVVVGKATTN